jgi:hypothetical protein
VHGGKRRLWRCFNFVKTGLALAGICGQEADFLARLVKTSMAKLNSVTTFGILALSSLVLGGCMSSPTYGTGKTANSQLLDDVSNIVSIAPKKGEKIEYAPRPELVKPVAGAPLPAPQESAKSQAAGTWPESPEQRRARLRAEATAGQDDPNFVPKIKNDGFGVQTEELSPAEQQAAFRAARKANTAGSAVSRTYLSEPPLVYRAPAETAAVGDLGEPEKKKERRLKKEASKSSGKKSFRDYLPWL